MGADFLPELPTTLSDFLGLQARERPNRRAAWGYTFNWTELHQTKEQLRPQTFQYDVLGSECLERLDQFQTDTSKLKILDRKADSEQPSVAQSALPRRDLYALLQHHADEDEKLQKLWLQVNTTPEWVDWAQLARGQDVFYRYAGPMTIGLTFQSLLGGMGGRRVVETLGRTGGFGPKVVKRRLLETYHYIQDVMRDVDSIKPGGDGFASSIRVRFLHASVRRRILQLAKEQEGYFDVEQHGLPINDLDSIGTVSTFSTTLIWLALPVQGIFMRKQEIVDLLAVWRYLAYLLGTPTESFSSPERAKAMLESLMLADIDPTDKSRTLAANILAGLAGQPPAFASMDFLRAEAYWLNGRRLATALHIPRPPLRATLLVMGQCLLLMSICYVRRSIPALDRSRIKATRRFFHKLVDAQLGRDQVHHDFKYIPSIDRMGEPTVKPTPLAVVRHDGAERSSLQMLLMAVLVAAGAVYLATRAAMQLIT